MVEPPTKASRRIAIVTGGGSGLGQALSLRLAQDGWHVIVADINSAGAEETERAICEAGAGSAEPFELDVTDKASWERMRTQLESRDLSLHLLVNNAGILATGEVGTLPTEDWQRVLQTNLTGAYLGCHTFVDLLKATHDSHILNISSIMGFTSGPANAAYNVAKAGVLSLSETLFCELKRYDVGVTVACPAYFATKLVESGHFSRDSEQAYAEWETRSSKVTAEQVADTVVSGVYAGRFYVMTPFMASRGVWFLKRLAPRLFMRLVESIGRKRLERLEAKHPSTATQSSDGESTS